MAYLISCGKLGKNHIIYPIIAIIIIIIRNYIFFETKMYLNLIPQHFIKIIVKSFGKSLAIIPFIIFKKGVRYSIKVDANSGNGKLHNKDYIYKFTEISKIQRKKKYFVLSFNLIISLLFEILSCYLKNDNEKLFSFWVFSIIYIWILSYFILKNKLYRHHYFSILIIVLLGIIVNLINSKGSKFDSINVIMALSTDILFSLNLVINKYLIDNLLFTEYQICFYEGFFCIIPSIIALVIFTKYNIGDNNDFYDYYDKIDGEEIFILILSPITHLIVYLFSLMTIKYFTVFHIFVILIVNEGNFYIYSLSQWRLYANLILYLFIIFMFLIFNENIEVNCFGLEKYTKRNIIRRASKDYLKNKDCYKINDKDKEYNLENSFDEYNEKASDENIIEIGRFRFDFSNTEITEGLNL